LLNDLLTQFPWLPLVIGSRLKTEGTYRIRFVRPCVRPCVPASVRASVTAYLRNRSEDFSETWHEVGGKKCKKHSTAVFLRFRPVFAKIANLC
jgi:hypothetical protein